MKVLLIVFCLFSLIYFLFYESQSTGQIHVITNNNNNNNEDFCYITLIPK